MERPSQQRRSIFQENAEIVKSLFNKEMENRKANLPPLTDIFRHQIDAVREAKTYLSNANNPKPALILAPTGSGKTGIIGLLPYVMESRRTMVLTPSPLISMQIANAITYPVRPSNFFEKARCFPPNWSEEDKAQFLPQALVVTNRDQIDGHNYDLVIVNAQRLGGNSRTNAKKVFNYEDPDMRNRLTRFFDKVDLLIVDEAHHFPAPTWVNIKNAFEATNPGKNIVFITATAERMLKGKKVRILTHEHDAYVLTKEALEAEVRRELRYLHLKHSSKISTVATNDLKKHLVMHVMKRLEKQDNEEGRFVHQALVTVRTTAEAVDLANIFNEMHPNSAKAITGGRIASECEIREYKEGRFRVAVVCKMLVEGFDNPSISVCAIFKQNNSQLFFEQFLGRCMRRMRFRDGQPDSSFNNV